jgi:NADPH:quinone reductase-like Zn-dependent oxidoreductase
MGNDEEFEAIVEIFRSRKLYPPVDSVFPIAESRAAYERLEAGQQFGKIVIELGETA